MDTDKTIRIAALSQQELTFLAPPSNGLDSRTFTLTVNNASQNVTLKYSETATARVASIVGDYPIINGRRMLPATSAAALTILGSGFVSTIAAEVDLSICAPRISQIGSCYKKAL